MNRVDSQKGFTIIELTLAMAFVSFLLLAIALSVIQVGSIYNRGMMLKEVNQTSRDISNDFTHSIEARGEINMTTDYVQVSSGGLKLGGRLCLGSVSYIWNYGEAVQRSEQGQSVDITKNWDGKPVRIAKVVDPTKKYCAKDAVSGALVTKNIATADKAQTNELLREGDRTLELYQLEVISPLSAYDAATGQRLYTILYTIGSGKYDALVADRTACKGPTEPGSDLQYCTVEQFSVVVRAGSDGS